MSKDLVKESQFVTSYVEDDDVMDGFMYLEESVETPESSVRTGPIVTLLPEGDTFTFKESDEEECSTCGIDEDNESSEEDEDDFDLKDLLNDSHSHEVDINENKHTLSIDNLTDDELDMIASSNLPGSDEPISKAEDSEVKKETSWKNDRDSSKFMEYLADAYKNIPRHDGTSTLGCERAISYLNSLNKEISEAIRVDKEGSLNDKITALEKYRSKIINDVMVLKNHIKKLNEQHSKKASNDNEQIIKEATTPRIQLVMTPFERAVSGMIINAVVSAGHSFDDVYEFVKDKYKLDEREELAIMQILLDMGHPIFKDRGTISGNKDKSLVDFMKNYFA